jgi:hypothetical protein
LDWFIQIVFHQTFEVCLVHLYVPNLIYPNVQNVMSMLQFVSEQWIGTTRQSLQISGVLDHPSRWSTIGALESIQLEKESVRQAWEAHFVSFLAQTAYHSESSIGSEIRTTQSIVLEWWLYRWLQHMGSWPMAYQRAVSGVLSSMLFSLMTAIWLALISLPGPIASILSISLLLLGMVSIGMYWWRRRRVVDLKPFSAEEKSTESSNKPMELDDSTEEHLFETIVEPTLCNVYTENSWSLSDSNTDSMRDCESVECSDNDELSSEISDDSAVSVNSSDTSLELYLSQSSSSVSDGNSKHSNSLGLSSDIEATIFDERLEGCDDAVVDISRRAIANERADVTRNWTLGSSNESLLEQRPLSSLVFLSLPIGGDFSLEEKWTEGLPIWTSELLPTLPTSASMVSLLAIIQYDGHAGLDGSSYLAHSMWNEEYVQDFPELEMQLEDDFIL